MSATVQKEDGDVYRVDITGLLRKAELDDVQEGLVGAMERSGLRSIRLLVILTDFEGWEPGAAWNDLSFYVRHGDSIARIAIVGDERWRGHALMFAAADLRRGPVEYFTPDEIERARTWLAE